MQYRVTLPNDREPLDKVIEVVGFVFFMFAVRAVYVDEDGYIQTIDTLVLRANPYAPSVTYDAGPVEA